MAFEINDPATGTFNSRVDIDAVRQVTVETGGFSSQYAHAGGGIIALDTQSGDDKLRFGITNFVPGVSLQEGVRFGNWYPRVTFSGPLKKGKIWFSEALTIQHTLRIVRELPRDQSTDGQWVDDNLVRLQVNLTPKNILQGSFLHNQLWIRDPALGLFSPVSTTLYSRSRRYFASFKDQIWIGGTLLDVGAAVDRGYNTTTPQEQHVCCHPLDDLGKLFPGAFCNFLNGCSWLGNVTNGSLKWFGEHTPSAGWNWRPNGFLRKCFPRSEIDFLRADGTLFERANIQRSCRAALVQYSNWRIRAGCVAPVQACRVVSGRCTDWDRLVHRELVEPPA